MGQPMVLRLLHAGFTVTVWNRTASRTEACRRAGAQVAPTAAAAVIDAELVITMLESGPVVLEVVGAAFAQMPRGSLLIDMSSTRQSEALQLHDLLAVREIGFVDAPVSGGVAGAEAGTLAIMAGASAADFRRAEPILTALGNPTLVGLPGSGQLAKMCNQLIVGGTLILIAEALLLAQAGGADPAAVRQALRGGFADSKVLGAHGQRMLQRNFMPGGQIKSQSKDMDNILATAQHVNLSLPQAELIAAVYRRLQQTHPHADQSAALLDLEHHNPGVRLGDQPDRLPV